MSQLNAKFEVLLSAEVPFDKALDTIRLEGETIRFMVQRNFMGANQDHDGNQLTEEQAEAKITRYEEKSVIKERMVRALMADMGQTFSLSKIFDVHALIDELDKKYPSSSKNGIALFLLMDLIENQVWAFIYLLSDDEKIKIAKEEHLFEKHEEFEEEVKQRYTELGFEFPSEQEQAAERRSIEALAEEVADATGYAPHGEPRDDIDHLIFSEVLGRIRQALFGDPIE